MPKTGKNALRRSVLSRRFCPQLSRRGIETTCPSCAAVNAKAKPDATLIQTQRLLFFSIRDKQDQQLKMPCLCTKLWLNIHAMIFTPNNISLKTTIAQQMRMPCHYPQILVPQLILLSLDGGSAAQLHVTASDSIIGARPLFDSSPEVLGPMGVTTLGPALLGQTIPGIGTS
eukprot:3886450-Amphidinium_carterae.2